MEIEGIVKAISIRNKGIKIDDKWYNIPEELLSSVSKGDRVRAEIDDFGNILNLEVLDKFEQPSETSNKDIKIKSLDAALEIIKLTFQYGQFPAEFMTAKQSRTIEEEVNKFLDLLFKTQKKIEQWLKS